MCISPIVFSSPSARHSDLDSPSQQQARISASCATRELDELMASLSDFKVQRSTDEHWKGFTLSAQHKLGGLL